MSLYRIHVIRGPYLQRGRGLGSILKGIGSALVPWVSRSLKSIVRSPTTRSIARDLRRQGISAGIGMAQDAMQGRNVVPGLKRKARKFQKRSIKTLEKINQPKKGGKKKLSTSPIKKIPVVKKKRKQTLFLK